MSGNREHPLLAWLRRREEEMTLFLEELVRAESPSLDSAAPGRGLELLADELRRAGYRSRRIRGEGTGDHLFARPDQRRRHAPHQLVIGHVDTVWPLGSVEQNPPRIENGRLYPAPTT